MTTDQYKAQEEAKGNVVVLTEETSGIAFDEEALKVTKTPTQNGKFLIEVELRHKE